MTGEWPPDWLVLVLLLATLGGLATTATVLIATDTGWGLVSLAPAVGLLPARPAVR